MKSNKIQSIILVVVVVFAFCGFVLSSNSSKKPKLVGQKSDPPPVSPELDEVLLGAQVGEQAAIDLLGGEAERVGNGFQDDVALKGERGV